jgi:hypothetical protein
MLARLAYRYPYHQAIGLHLEKAGNHKPAQVNLLRHLDRHLDFYLTHEMDEPRYSKEWRVYYLLAF